MKPSLSDYNKALSLEGDEELEDLPTKVKEAYEYDKQIERSKLYKLRELTSLGSFAPLVVVGRGFKL